MDSDLDQTCCYPNSLNLNRVALTWPNVSTFGVTYVALVK